MPSLDDRDQVVGHVLRELKGGRYVKTYLVLNFETHHLLGYPGDIAVSLVRVTEREYPLPPHLLSLPPSLSLSLCLSLSLSVER